MEINNYNELDAFKTEVLIYMSLDWEPKENTVAKVEFLYETVLLKTNSHDLIRAYRYRELYRLQVTGKPKGDADTTTTLYRDNHPLVRQLHQEVKTDYDPSFNCFGAAVLGKKYWLPLDEYDLERFLRGDGYGEVKKPPRREHLVVYYRGQTPVHIARYNSEEKVYEHKIGYRATMLYLPTDDIRERYDYDGKKYYVK